MMKPISFFPLIVLLYSLCACEDGSSRLMTELSGIVSIELPKPMLNVGGNKVSSIHLFPGTAGILRYEHSTSPTYKQGNTRPGKNVRLGGYFFGGWENEKFLSDGQLSWIAKNLDVLTLNNYYIAPDNNLGGGITPDKVLWLKEQNPLLKYYCMLFATTLQEPLFDKSTMSEWVIRYKNGKEALGIRRGHDNDLNHLMDLGNKDYADFFRKFIIEHAQEYHADGVAIDEIMWNGYWGVDVADMKNYNSVEQIRQTCYDWLQIIKANNNKEVIHQAFWSEAQSYTDGIWGENSFFSYIRTNYDYKIFYESMDYNEIVETLSTYGQKNETYIWAAFYDGDSFKQLEYCIATYLLGKNGNHVVFQPHPEYNGGYPNNLSGYDIRNSINAYEKNKALFDIELGTPLGEFYTKTINGRKIWIRKFEKGIVFCNPNRS